MSSDQQAASSPAGGQPHVFTTIRKLLCTCPWFEDAEKTRHLMSCPLFDLPIDNALRIPVSSPVQDELTANEMLDWLSAPYRVASIAIDEKSAYVEFKRDGRWRDVFAPSLREAIRKAMKE